MEGRPDFFHADIKIGHFLLEQNRVPNRIMFWPAVKVEIIERLRMPRKQHTLC